MGQNNQHARRVPRSEKRAAIVFPTGLSRTRYPGFIGYFLLPETCVFFQNTNPDIFKNLELLLQSNISNSDNTEVVEWRVQQSN